METGIVIDPVFPGVIEVSTGGEVKYAPKAVKNGPLPLMRDPVEFVRDATAPDWASEVAVRAPAISIASAGAGTLTKAMLAQNMANACGVSKAAADAMVAELFAAVAEAVAKGDNVSIPGFGKFVVTARAERTGRHPRTGEEIVFAPSRRLAFKPAAALKGRLRT